MKNADHSLPSPHTKDGVRPGFNAKHRWRFVLTLSKVVARFRDAGNDTPPATPPPQFSPYTSPLISPPKTPFTSPKSDKSHSSLFRFGRPATAPSSAPSTRVGTPIPISAQNSKLTAASRDAPSVLSRRSFDAQASWRKLIATIRATIRFRSAGNQLYEDTPLTPHSTDTLPPEPGSPLTTHSMLIHLDDTPCDCTVEPSRSGTPDPCGIYADQLSRSIALMAPYIHPPDDSAGMPEDSDAHDTEEETMQLLKLTLQAKHHVDIALELRGEEAKVLMSALQEILDMSNDRFIAHSLFTPRYEDHVHLRRSTLHLLTKLATHSNELPPKLFIHGVSLNSGWEPDALGGFADVFRGSHSAVEVAVKRLRIIPKYNDRSAIHRRFCREALVWRQLKHRYILPFVGLYSDTSTRAGFPCMVSPWMHNGTVLDYINKAGPLNVDRRTLLAEIAEGIDYLHSQSILHGDIRGSNIFVNEGFHACLADFGLAVVSDATSGQITVTANEGGSKRWMAPELHRPEVFGLERFKRTQETDVYAFGCIVLEVYTRKAPFAATVNDWTVVMQVLEEQRPAHPSDEECGGEPIPGWLWETATMCWSHWPQVRPHMADVARKCWGEASSAQFIRRRAGYMLSP